MDQQAELKALVGQTCTIQYLGMGEMENGERRMERGR